jgi:S-adenosylmethionine:tRNA ribosyltransferase-isomerase
VDIQQFDYDLPPSAIAQEPAESRDSARLLVVDRARRTWSDRRVSDLPELLRPGDCLVLNDSRVIPARVLARVEGTDAAGDVELLFIREHAPERWEVLARPARRLRLGTRLAVADGAWTLRVTESGSHGARVVESESGPVLPRLDQHGLVPLPPYIQRHAKPLAADWDRYQTVYADPPGSVAAPTAGLHLTRELLARLRAAGVEVQVITLHVGPGTFRPIRAERVEDHLLAPERVRISPPVAAAVTRARHEGRRIVACGTTATRALEAASAADGSVRALDGPVDLYVTPGHRFDVVDALLTNFHLPRSSLLVLVAAFAGRDLVLDAYRHALASGYRFFSYGDANLIL